MSTLAFLWVLFNKNKRVFLPCCRWLDYLHLGFFLNRQSNFRLGFPIADDLFDSLVVHNERNLWWWWKAFKMCRERRKLAIQFSCAFISNHWHTSVGYIISMVLCTRHRMPDMIEFLDFLFERIDMFLCQLFIFHLIHFSFHFSPDFCESLKVHFSFFQL